MTLIEDFKYWWNLPKFEGVDIPVKEYSEVEITQRHGSNAGWPGPEKDVHYWVELENGMAVGIITPRKKLATFPFYRMGNV